MTSFLGFLVAAVLFLTSFSIIAWRRYRRVYERLTTYETYNGELQSVASRIASLQSDCEEAALSKQKINEEIEECKSYLNTLDFLVDARNNELVEARVQLEGVKAEDASLRRTFDERKSLLEERYHSQIASLQRDHQMSAEQLRNHMKAEYDALVGDVARQHSILEAAMRQNRDAQEDENRRYLEVPPHERAEVAELTDVCRHLRNPVPLYKAIYETYFRTPVGTLANDLGAKGKCGIYRITDRVNGKLYIGQAVDIGDRWRQHVRRGSGAEVGTISGSKLYGAMMEHGLWNFRFEIVEEVEREKLNEREKFWIEYFGAVEFGYNMRS